MTYYGSKQLADSFRIVRKNTLTIAEEIPEQSYIFQPASGTRTVGQTLIHIALAPSLAEQVHFVERRRSLEGFDYLKFVGRITTEEQTPRSKEAIIEMLSKGGDKFAALLEGASEEFLGEIVAHPPGFTPSSKSRFEMLMSPKEHEMHHRGQLMLVERMLGLTPHLTRAMQARLASMETSQAAGSGR